MINNMNLLIDIGNTRIKWARGTPDGLEAAGEALHRERVDAAVAELLAAQDPPRRVLAANVAGEALGRVVESAVQQKWQLPVEFAQTQSAAGGITNGYQDYRLLGIDRWLTLLATAAAGTNVCVVDAGTAVTIDALTAQGRHLGGYIVPGLGLMRAALGAETGNLQSRANESGGLSGDTAPAFGDSTAAAITGGTLAMVCALINQCVKELESLAAPVDLVLTGGDADRLLPWLPATTRLRPQLVLEGLALYKFGGSRRD